jgi:hypothetical protein
MCLMHVRTRNSNRDMNTEKKWKRGDIGPDGRVFWAYDKTRKNGERWIDADRFQQLYEKMAEAGRHYRQENREKLAERDRRYKQGNREKVEETKRRHYQENREKLLERHRHYSQENREKVVEVKRRYKLKKTLQKSTPKTLQEFYDSLYRPSRVITVIFSLTPDEGQTLAELIHELSGYPMELCEQIANPPEPEPETEPIPEPQPPPVILPDLF